MKRKIIYLLILIINISGAFAQDKIIALEDSLKNLGTIITNDTIFENRNKANALFIKTLVSALKEPSSFNYSFKNLDKFIHIQKSEDNTFRIFSWFNQKDDGTFRYFGAIQMNNPSKLALYPLFDNSDNFKDVDALADSTLTTNQWYGAIYYQIIPVLNSKEPYYILLGWKGKNYNSSCKIIETISFNSEKPTFGMAVLETSSKSNQFMKRKIFNYDRNASVLLKYINDEKTLVFDHLVGEKSQSKDLFVPDLSYDGYKLKFDKWLFQENLKLKNPPSENDDFFIDPTNQSNKPTIK
jgi:hypothetical protein